MVISVANLQGDDVYFKVKPTMRLQKIFDAYANRKGVAGDSLRFLFKGSRVDGEPTCADIGLEDGDQLDVENSQDAAIAITIAKGIGFRPACSATPIAMGNISTAAAMLVIVAVNSTVIR